MRQFFFISSLLFLSFFSFSIIPSCVGYQLGNTKHQKLKDIRNIYIPMIEDKTLEIKLAPQATNQIIKAISKDGTYRVTRPNDSDATLKAVIRTINYDEFRSDRLDTLRAEELIMSVVIDWELVDNSGKILQKGVSTGSTRFFADSNQRLSRDNAKSDALQKIAQKITSRLSNGF